MSDKVKFYWASIAGADPEPVEIIEIAGRKAVITIGCSDPFFLDDTMISIRIDKNMMERPHKRGFQTAEEAEAARLAYEQQPKTQRYHQTHGWRGPR
jgi:hypothetical protein